MEDAEAEFGPPWKKLSRSEQMDLECLVDSEVDIDSLICKLIAMKSNDRQTLIVECLSHFADWHANARPRRYDE